MSDNKLKLENYPPLFSWFQENKIGSSTEKRDLISQFVWSLCYALTLEQKRMLKSFALALETLINNSLDPSKDFHHAENTLSAGGINILDMLTKVCELAILSDEGPLYFRLMSNSADKTKLAVFRFLSAWIALNTNDLESCILECDKVDEPYSSILTLHGQALLESGRSKEAIEVFKIAVEMSPKEILALFQLAKAAFVEENWSLAWDSVQKAHSLDPRNIEIATMMGFIALGQKTAPDRMKIAWDQLFAHMQKSEDNDTLISVLMDLSFRLTDPSKLMPVVERANWPSLKKNGDFLQKVPWILKELDKLKWQKMSVRILEGLT